MDYPGSPATLMYQSFTHRRSCTTQSDPAKPGPAFSDENTIMAMSPREEMSEPCQGQTQQPFQYLPASYSPQQQANSYTTSTLPLAYQSPLPSQLVVRQHTWPAPQTSSWSAETTAQDFTASGIPREPPWNGLSQGGVQPWVSSQHYQQVPLRGEVGYPQSQPYGPTLEQTSSYGPRESPAEGVYHPAYGYPNMAPAATFHPADSHTGGYSVPAEPTGQRFPPYRATQVQPSYADATCARSLETAQSLAMLSSSQVKTEMKPDEEHPQSPMSPCSYYSDDAAGAHDIKAGDIKAEMQCRSPSVEDGMKESSVPPSPGKPVETPYAQLIYKALMSTPRRAMKLQEIYQWFLENTDKGQPGQGRGWQNSIRHNLSMNGAFERRPIKGEVADSGDDYLSPSGSSKPATEWVLVDEFVAKGVNSTTRYRNASRRSHNKRLRGRNRADVSSRRSSRRPAMARSAGHPYPYALSLPPLQHLDRAYYGQYVPPYDTAADQMERLSLAPGLAHERRAVYYGGGPDYDQADYRATGAMGSPMGGANMHSGYSSARCSAGPLNYSSELFMPSAPGPPTVASEDDVNEVITPEASFSVLEPAVLLPGEGTSTIQGPTSDPYSNGGGTTYYPSQGPGTGDPQTVARYTLADVAGVCDESMLRSCGRNGNQPSRQ